MNESLRYKMSTISCCTAIGLIYKDFINSEIKGNVSTKILEQNRKKISEVLNYKGGHFFSNGK